MSCRLPLVFRLFCFALLCFVFRLHAFVEAATLRSIVLRYAGAPIASRVFFFEMSLFPSIFLLLFPLSRYCIWRVVVVVVVFTLTDRASTIPSNIRGCQSGTWSQRGTKVNRSHHGDNPLLRPTGIQIATKSYATLQAMAPTNSKTVHQTSFTPYREQPRSTEYVVRSCLPNGVFLPCDHGLDF